MPAIEKNYILSADAARKKMRRMAYEILENNTDVDHIIFLGIIDNGLIVARAVASIVSEISGITTEVVGVSLDKKHPSVVKTDRPVDFNDKVVILVDDVTNSGKTLTNALSLCWRPILKRSRPSLWWKEAIRNTPFIPTMLASLCQPFCTSIFLLKCPESISRGLMWYDQK